MHAYPRNQRAPGKPEKFTIGTAGEEMPLKREWDFAEGHGRWSLWSEFFRSVEKVDRTFTTSSDGSLTLP